MCTISLFLIGCNDPLDYQEIDNGEFFGTNPSIIFATNNEDIRIFYKITSDSEKTVAVTSEQMNGSYNCELKISTGITCNGVTYKVTAIGNRAFYHSNLTKLTIPNTIKKIGAEAFLGSTLPTNIVIPNGVTSIGEFAFNQCKTIKTVNIPTGLNVITSNAFSYCIGLTKINLPDGLDSISDAAFMGCTNLSNVSFPNNINHIGFFAFARCLRIKSVILPNGMKVFNMSSFYGCTSLSRIDIPNNINYVWTKIEGCSNLKEIHCKRLYPPGCLPNNFDNITSCKLYVPFSSKIIYQSAPDWKNFSTIIEE
jgi:hypothetical protein